MPLNPFDFAGAAEPTQLPPGGDFGAEPGLAPVGTDVGEQLDDMQAIIEGVLGQGAKVEMMPDGQVRTTDSNGNRARTSLQNWLSGQVAGWVAGGKITQEQADSIGATARKGPEAFNQSASGQTTAQREGARAAASRDAGNAARRAAGGGGGGAPPPSTPSRTTTTETSGGGGQFVGGEGPPPIDPNAGLGLDFGAAAGSVQGGDQRFSDPSVFGRPTPFTGGLGPDASLNDILLGAMGEQRATRDMALGISGGLARGFEDSELRQQAERNAISLGEDPFSLNDETISRIQGQQGELIGRNAERLQQASAGRAASAGISRSGIQNASQDRIDINAARQLGESQRGLLVEQATRRPQELAAAARLGTDVLGQQQRARESIAGGAIGTLQGTDITGDAAILGTIAGGGTPQININRNSGDFRDTRERPGNF